MAFCENASYSRGFSVYSRASVFYVRDGRVPFLFFSQRLRGSAGGFGESRTARLRLNFGPTRRSGGLGDGGIVAPDAKEDEEDFDRDEGDGAGKTAASEAVAVQAHAASVFLQKNLIRRTK